MSNTTPYFYLKKQQDRREKKTNQQYKRRFKQKRKRSLISLPSSVSSILSDTLPELTNVSDNGSYNISNEDAMLFDASSSPSPSSPSCFSSSSSSSTNTSEDESDTKYKYSHFSDDRPLYSSSTTTVSDFSRDLLEFSRISRLPNKQRSHLLNLFQKYLPSPNSVPTSSDHLLGKFE